MSMYLTIEEADTLAETMLNLTAWEDATDPQKTAALAQASQEIDASSRWQGRKYDPTGAITGTRQVLEFPRVAYGTASGTGAYPNDPYAVQQSEVIWDWDDEEDEAVVPDAVKRAVLRQANYLLAGTRSATVDRQQSGLASQSAGGLSESYHRPASGSEAAWELLAPEARTDLQKYRLRSGQLR